MFNQLSLELGNGLVPLVAELRERIEDMCCQVALDMGIVIPKIIINENKRLGSFEYCFKIGEVYVEKSVIRKGCCIRIKPGRTVMDLPAIITGHLTKIVKRYAAEFMGFGETQIIIDGVKKNYPALVNKVLSGKDEAILENTRKVLQGLLKEQVSIRGMAVILEAIADFDLMITDTQLLVEKARQALAVQICRQYADDDRTIHVFTLDPPLEQKILESKFCDDFGNNALPERKRAAAPEIKFHNAFVRAARVIIGKVHLEGRYPVVLCSAKIRYFVRILLEKELPEVAVLSFSEIAKGYSVEFAGVIGLKNKYIRRTK